jgi:hypothetical protein
MDQKFGHGRLVRHMVYRFYQSRLLGTAHRCVRFRHAEANILSQSSEISRPARGQQEILKILLILSKKGISKILKQPAWTA